MNANNVISENADANMTAHRLVKFTATGVAYAGTADNPCGTLLNDVALGKAAAVALKKSYGLHYLTVLDNTAIAAGDELQIGDANGQVQKLASGKAVGVAREPSTVAGSIIRGYLYSGAAGEAAESGESALSVPQTGTAAVTQADGSDAASTQALANDIKSKYNTLRTKLIAAGVLS